MTDADEMPNRWKDRPKGGAVKTRRSADAAGIRSLISEGGAKNPFLPATPSRTSSGSAVLPSSKDRGHDQDY